MPDETAQTAQTTDLTFAQYADWVARQLQEAGFEARAWHGNRGIHRIYLTKDVFLEVTGSQQNYGHALTALPRWYKSKSLVAALALIGEDVLTIDKDEIGVRGVVEIASPTTPGRSGLVGTLDGATRTISPFAAERPDLAALIGTVRVTRDGAAWVVLGAEARHHSDRADNDENLRTGWYMTLHVRPATPEEAAPALAARVQRDKERERTIAASSVAQNRD